MFVNATALGCHILKRNLTMVVFKLQESKNKETGRFPKQNNYLS